MLKHFVTFISTILILCNSTASEIDVQKFNALLDSAKKYTNHQAQDREIAATFFQEAFSKLAAAKDSNLVARYYLEKSFLSLVNNEIELARVECAVGLAAIKNSKLKPIAYYRLLNRLGMSYFVENAFDQSITKFLEIIFSIESNIYSKEIASEVILKIEADALSRVAQINFNLFAEKKSVDYYKKAIKKYEELLDSGMLKYSLFGLAKVYIEQDDLQKAEDNIRKAFLIPEHFNNKFEFSNFYLTHGYYYLKTDQLDSAVKYIDLAMLYKGQFGDLNGVKLASIYKAQYFFQQNEFGAAKKLLEQVLDTDLITKTDRAEIKAYRLLSEVCKELGDVETAYEHATTSLKLQNQILQNAETFFSYEIENKLDITKRQYKDSIGFIKNDYQLKQTELKLKEKSRTNRFLIVIILLFIVVTVVLGAVLRANHYANRKLKRTIDENAILFKEVHHRVKNNFQVISSLLNLQKNTVDNPETDDILTETQQRILSMALVHELLYKHDQIDQINTEIYFNELVDSIKHVYNTVSANIKFDIVTNNIVLKLDQAIPLGLIVNEAVTNSVKHGFPGGKEGKIEMTLSAEGNKYVLLISDNGVGISGESIASSNTLGLELIEILAEQINGEKLIYNENGTVVQVIFAN